MLDKYLSGDELVYIIKQGVSELPEERISSKIYLDCDIFFIKNPTKECDIKIEITQKEAIKKKSTSEDLMRRQGIN